MGPINYFSPVVYKGPNTDFWAPWMDTTTPRAGVKLSNGEFQPDPICTGFDESWMPYFDIRTRYSSLEEIRRYKRGFEPWYDPDQARVEALKPHKYMSGPEKRLDFTTSDIADHVKLIIEQSPLIKARTQYPHEWVVAPWPQRGPALSFHPFKLPKAFSTYNSTYYENFKYPWHVKYWKYGGRHLNEWPRPSFTWLWNQPRAVDCVGRSYRWDTSTLVPCGLRGVKITPRGCNFTPKRELVEALPIAKDVIPSVGGTEVALSAVTAGNCGLTLCVTAFVVGAIVLITLLATGGGASSSSAVSKIYWLSDTSKKAIEGSNWLLGQCDEITSFWGAVLSPVWALLFGPP